MWVETIYMVTSGRHYNGGCCFDYGNAEIGPPSGHGYGRGNMEAIYWGCGDVLRHFRVQTEYLPRQARDKHRKVEKNKDTILQEFQRAPLEPWIWCRPLDDGGP